MTKPVNWTRRLPLASLRGVAEATRPIRAVIDSDHGDDTDLTVEPKPELRRATLAEFAATALEEAERLDTAGLEVRPERFTGPRLLPPDRFDALTVSPLAAWFPYTAGWPAQVTADLAAADGSYGVVLCVGALERHPEPLPLMRELSRILQPSGQLYLVAPLIVPAPVTTATPTGSGRRRYGLNYLLDATALHIEYLEPVERSSAYAVVARKSSRLREGRCATDRR